MKGERFFDRLMNSFALVIHVFVGPFTPCSCGPSSGHVASPVWGLTSESGGRVGLRDMPERPRYLGVGLASSEVCKTSAGSEPGVLSPVTGVERQGLCSESKVYDKKKINELRV